jgi:hypothetical protein
MTKKKVKAVAASTDTVTFKKSALIEKLKVFLENEDACDKDWVNKVRVEFLGEKLKTVRVRLRLETEVELEMTTNGMPTFEEAKAKVVDELEEDNLSFDFDQYSDFEVVEITQVQ